MSKKLVLRLVAAVVVLGCCNFSRADSITFQQGAGYDAGGATIRNDTGRADSPENNGSQAGQIIVGWNGSFGLRGLLEFDLSALKAAVGHSQFVIDSVSLTLNAFNAASSGTGSVRYDLNLLGANYNFDETTVTWNNAPMAHGGTVGQLLSTVTYIPNTYKDLTSGDTISAQTGHHTFADTPEFLSAVQNALDLDANNTIRFMLKAHTESGTNFTRFDSDDATTPTNRPALTINYTVLTPLPGAATAGLVLMGGLGLRRTRRRA